MCENACDQSTWHKKDKSGNFSHSGERTGSGIFFSFSRSQTPHGQCNRYNSSCLWRRQVSPIILEKINGKPRPLPLPQNQRWKMASFCLACENIRFSSLFAARDISRETFPAAKSEEKRMFSQTSFCPSHDFILDLVGGGDRGLLLHFILSKIVA